MLSEEGGIRLKREDFEHYLKKPLVCHVCRAPQKNMPTLKRHIQDHL